MKPSKTVLALAALAILGLTTGMQAESKRTAEYLLSTPNEFDGKDVTVDVAFVKPVHWVSPIPEIAFFHALTIDRSDRKPGGGILVAIPVEDAKSFARKYGTDFDGRFDADALKGVFTSAGGPPKDQEHGRRIWLIDTTGQLQKLIADKKINLPLDEGMDSGFGPGPGPGPGKHHKP